MPDKIVNPQNRKKTGRFQKGKSGNPGGRPPIPDAFKKHVKDAEDKILELMQSEDEDIALKAATLILAYVKGRPTENVQVTDVTDYAAVLKARRAKLCGN